MKQKDKFQLIVKIINQNYMINKEYNFNLKPNNKNKLIFVKEVDFNMLKV